MTKSIKKWFTLIEMLIVIVIIGILAWVLIPKIGWAREKANDVAVKANVRSLAQWVLQMQLAWTWTPADFNALNTADNATKYNFNYVDNKDNTYTYGKASDSNKFIICGKLSSAEWGWNSAADAASDYNGSFTETWAGEFYCYQG